MNDNSKFRSPKIAITKAMVDAGKEHLQAMLNAPDEHTDDALVVGIFYRMWEVYWSEIDQARRKKTAGSPIIQFVKKPKLILPEKAD